METHCIKEVFELDESKVGEFEEGGWMTDVNSLGWPPHWRPKLLRLRGETFQLCSDSQEREAACAEVVYVSDSGSRLAVDTEPSPAWDLGIQTMNEAHVIERHGRFVTKASDQGWSASRYPLGVVFRNETFTFFSEEESDEGEFVRVIYRAPRWGELWVDFV